MTLVLQYAGTTCKSKGVLRHFTRMFILPWKFVSMNNDHRTLYLLNSLPSLFSYLYNWSTANAISKTRNMCIMNLIYTCFFQELRIKCFIKNISLHSKMFLNQQNKRCAFFAFSLLQVCFWRLWSLALVEHHVKHSKIILCFNHKTTEHLFLRFQVKDECKDHFIA